MTVDARSHWQDAYARKAPDEVSWFEEAPRESLALIESVAHARQAAIIDVGGGASRLAGRLLLRGYRDLTVADISAVALERARLEIGSGAGAVTWVETDVRDHDFGREFDLWHDRAVFHFMVEDTDRACYLETLSRSLRSGGRFVLATFGPDGPTRCSGLPVRRYGADELATVLGPGWTLESSHLQVHETPAGNEQQFQYSVFRRHETVTAVLEAARSGLERLLPAEAQARMRNGAALIDIRGTDQRESDGAIPGAIKLSRNVLEWRCDPSSSHRDPAVARRDRQLVLICDEGYQSSLAAATLRSFGLDATDVIGGFQAWRESGMPIEQPVRGSG